MKRALVAAAVILIGSVFVSSAKAQTVVYGGVTVAPAPTVVYRYPLATRAYVPAPVPVYRYRVGVPYAVRYPYYVGPRAVVRTKVYYPGQPIRNYWKAITW